MKSSIRNQRCSLWIAIALALLVGCDTGPTPASTGRVVLIGIDGATWDVITPLVRQGALPGIARLMRDGSHGPLETLKPTWSPRIWTSIVTGVLPKHHGIEQFTVRDPDTGRKKLPTSDLRRVKAVWNIASDAGYSVGVVNWWASFPAEEIDGFIVSDRVNYARRMFYRANLGVNTGDLRQRSPRETYPASLLAELEPVLGRAIDDSLSRARSLAPDLSPARATELASQRRFTRGNRLSILRFSVLEDLSAIAATRHALGSLQPDLLLFYIGGLDYVEHHFWKFHEPGAFRAGLVDPDDRAMYHDVIHNYYRWVDQVVSDLIEWIGNEPATVILVSDHGHHAHPGHNAIEPEGYAANASGGHDDAPPGILIVSGANAATGARLRPSSILDITPTVLALLGLPTGADMAGRVISEALSPQHLRIHPVHEIASHSAAWIPPRPAQEASPGDEAMLEKLRAIGYVE